MSNPWNHLLNAPPVAEASMRPARERRGQNNLKYDHAQMIRDRIAGMTWLEISIKHDMPAQTDGRRATKARAAVLESVAFRELTPREVALIEGVDGRRKSSHN